MLPELADFAFSEEARSTCGACAMVDAGASTSAGSGPRRPDPHAFSADTRCCTFHPELPNFLVGRALRRGGATRERVMARIARGEGIDAIAIRPPADHVLRYLRQRETAFGRDATLRCPYWAGGELACGVWEDRNAVCRTWFCKHDEGERGYRAWDALRYVLEYAEDRLARWAADRVEVPNAGASAGDWADYYEACAAAVDRITPEEVDALRDVELAALLDDLAQRVARRDAALPDRVRFHVLFAEPGDGVLRLTSYATHDLLDVPPEVVGFFRGLEAGKPWREALAGTGLGEDVVVALWKAGVLSAVFDV